MVSLSRKEIEWTASELMEKSEHLKNLSTLIAATDAEKALCTLRAEQLQIIAEKLTEALEKGARRIEIR